MFGSTVPGVVCIRQDSVYDRIAKISQAFVWRLAEDLVRTVYAACQDEVSVFGWENGMEWGPCQKAWRCGKGAQGFD